ncbi:hypothetical protein [Actinomadura fibrosa]|uniref:Uncharacterized protein n=1 Tax=Actinomadura fibrosa TaxID=111802 RepID=A0ABW2Y3W1_9ACTN|nr:hypothetical protein [Actinomadura fibrosa]
MGTNKIDHILNSPNPTPAPAPAPAPTPAPTSGGGRPSPAPAPAPPSGTTPPSAAKTSGEVHFSPESLRKLGDALEKEVGAILKEARYKLNVKPRDAQPDAFTTFGFFCAMAYTELIEFADQDLISKSKATMDFNDRLHAAAKNQDEAERKSTIKGGGS